MILAIEPQQRHLGWAGRQPLHEILKGYSGVRLNFTWVRAPPVVTEEAAVGPTLAKHAGKSRVAAIQLPIKHDDGTSQGNRHYKHEGRRLVHISLAWMPVLCVAPASHAHLDFLGILRQPLCDSKSCSRLSADGSRAA